MKDACRCLDKRAIDAVAATADQLATQAAMTMFSRGGNAVDAAIAANAAIAVTGPHLCGLGGDLFALVHHPGDGVVALNASGRAGSGRRRRRAAGRGPTAMPMRHDVRTVTVPGCVDGWMALHERFGAWTSATVLGPAIRLAASGFPASPLLVGSLCLPRRRRPGRASPSCSVRAGGRGLTEQLPSKRGRAASSRKEQRPDQQRAGREAGGGEADGRARWSDVQLSERSWRAMQPSTQPGTVTVRTSWRNGITVWPSARSTSASAPLPARSLALERPHAGPGEVDPGQRGRRPGRTGAGRSRR